MPHGMVFVSVKTMTSWWLVASHFRLTWFCSRNLRCQVGSMATHLPSAGTCHVWRLGAILNCPVFLEKTLNRTRVTWPNNNAEKNLTPTLQIPFNKSLYWNCSSWWSWNAPLTYCLKVNLWLTVQCCHVVHSSSFISIDTINILTFFMAKMRSSQSANEVRLRPASTGRMLQCSRAWSSAERRVNEHRW